jgi:hypothetical protein
VAVGVSHVAPAAWATVVVSVDGTTTAGLAPGLYDAQVSFTDVTYSTVDTFHHAVLVDLCGSVPLPPAWFCQGCGAEGCGGDICCGPAQ